MELTISFITFGMKNWPENHFINSSRIDDVFRPIFHSKRDQKKNYKLYFVSFNNVFVFVFFCCFFFCFFIIKHVFSNIKKF
jgi:hypothetical protein